MKYNRRQFLRLTGAGLGGAYLSSCATLDRWFFDDENDDRNQVVILGAGLSGLTTAYYLKKSNIPFRIYEASSRVGGRVYTIYDDNVPIDLGAEWVNSQDQEILQLSRELKINLLQAFEKKLSISEFHFQSTWLKIDQIQFIQKNIWKSAVKILNQNPTASVQNLIQREKLDAISSVWLRRQCQWVLGVDPENVSLKCFIDRWPWAEGTHLRFEEGASQLPKVLAEKVMGILPHHILRLQHELVSVELEGGDYFLTFQTPSGRRVIRSNQVVCTMPWTAFRSVRGLDQLPLSSSTVKQIKTWDLGQHSKLAGRAKAPISLQRIFSDTDSQCYWKIDKKQMLLMSQMGGVSGLLVGEHSLKQWREDIKKIWDVDPHFTSTWVQNWSQMPWAKGSVSFLKPGQDYPVSFENMNWLFAGEHLSSRPGTMCGAVQSGMKIAQMIIGRK